MVLTEMALIGSAER